MFIGSVQVGFGGVDAAQVKSLADLLDGECSLFPEAGGDGEFGGIVFASGGELFGGPAEAIEFFSDDALGAEDGVFNAKLAGCFFCLCLDQVEHLLLENGRAEAPTAPYRAEGFFVFLSAARFDAREKFGTGLGSVIAQAVFAE